MPRWAYWALWVFGTGMLLLPAVAPGSFAKRGAAPLFQLNYRQDGTGADRHALRDRHVLVRAEGLPAYQPETLQNVNDTPGVGDQVRAQAENEFRAAEARMHWSRWWFPLGAGATVGLLVALRLTNAKRWADPERRLRGIAVWLVGMFATHYALMFLAHSFLGNRGDGLWEAEWLARGVVVLLAVLGVVALARARPREGWFEFLRLPPDPATHRDQRVGWFTLVPVTLLVLVGFFESNRAGRAYCGFTGAPAPLIGLFGLLTAGAGAATWLSGRGQWWLSAVAGVLLVPGLPNDCPGGGRA